MEQSMSEDAEDSYTLPKFNELLEQVHSSLEESDSFDLDGNDPVLSAEFVKLTIKYRDDARKFVLFVMANGDTLLDELRKMP